MNPTEIIEMIISNRDALIEELKDADMLSMRYPCCEYRVYIDSNGEIDHEEWPANDRAHYEFREWGYSRTYIHTFCNQYLEVLWDTWFVTRADFAEAFQKRFGVELLDLDAHGKVDNEARQTCDENSIPEAEYLSWLFEQEDEAIDLCISEAENDGKYEQILDEFIDDLKKEV